MIKKILTIAGSDCSGGAGIQADLKTITAHKMYGMSVITSLTAQNTLGVSEILNLNPKFIAKELDCVFQDIPPDAVKIGMLSNKDIIEIVLNKLKEYKAFNIVIDPVMMATSGGKLLLDNAVKSLTKKLFPLGTVITPNIPEAEILSGVKIGSEKDMLLAVKIIGEKLEGAVLIKGGHLLNNCNDLVYYQGETKWFLGDRINNPNTHGTGCTLSSAIACNLAQGKTIFKSIENAKLYLNGALKANLNLGKGRGPLNHVYNLN